MDNSLSGNIWTCTCGRGMLKVGTLGGPAEEKEIWQIKQRERNYLKI